MSLTRSMREAIDHLTRGDARLKGPRHSRETFHAPGAVIAGQTLTALARRRLVRSISRTNDCFTLTDAGRRLAATL